MESSSLRSHPNGPLALPRTSSHESLTAHPLLVSGPNTSPDSVRSVSGPKYLPYTPRQRVPTGSVTTGTTVSSPVSISPQQNQGGATSKLQLQNLKAVAQNHGLDVGSIGWTMLEELVIGSDHSPAWNEIWNAITAGKATLLLPLEQLGAREVLTPEFFKDHLVFCNGQSRSDAPVVTVSGLRGIINDDIVFRSTIPTTSKAYNALASPSSRASVLSSLPPLPFPVSPHLSYPQFQAPTAIEALPLPPRNVVPPKPPLPPRPGARPPTASTVSRISNPFASLFSKTSAPPSPSLLPTTDVPHVDHVVEVSAFTIDRPIIRRTVAKALTKCIKAELKESLVGVPTWVADRTQNFCADLLPFPKSSRKSRDSSLSDSSPVPYSVPALEELPEDLQESFQIFYETLEEELRAEGSPSTLRRRDDRYSMEEKERERQQADAKVRDILEKVERATCSVFYDRLFQQSNSDDASHDEALSSRIAALNILDLTLDHLGVDVRSSAIEVDQIVTACGQSITQLEATRCPADKAAMLVASHKIIVDGLSRLPALRLKSDGPVEDEKTPQNQKFSTDIPPAASPTSDISIKKIEVDNSSVDDKSLPSKELSHQSSVSNLSLPPAADTPLLTVSPPPPKTPTPVPGDILLPLIIFSVVKANPPQLVSHLLYTQRFRDRSVGGEESYCLINLMAVVEFLENVDLGALGLKDSESKVMSTADLTPIPITQGSLVSETSPAHAGLRGRVEQQVDAIADSANKVISGVVDSGFGVLRALLPTNAVERQNADGTATDSTEAAPWNNIRPGFGLLRRQSGFSIASLAASLPGRERSKSFASSHHGGDEGGQEMVESRPGSVRNMTLGDDDGDSSSGESEDGSSESSEEDGDNAGHDTKSIRSFESMLSSRNKRANAKERMSLSDRLAHMSRLTRSSSSVQPQDFPVHQGSPPPRLNTHLSAHVGASKLDSPASSRASSPIPGDRPRLLALAPPNRRFLECTADDLKMSEIPELLNEYRRLVEAARSLGAFDGDQK